MDHTNHTDLIIKWGGSGRLIPTAFIIKFFDASDPVIEVWNEDIETDFNAKTLKRFIDLSFDGKYAKYKRSALIPENNNGPVKTVVRKNFDEIVYDTTKHVFVEFYANWCAFCGPMEKNVEEVAIHFQDSKNILISRYDAEYNSIPESIPTITGYPAVMFFLAHDKKNPIVYDGDRTTEDLIKFVTLNIVDTTNLHKKEDL